MTLKIQLKDKEISFNNIIELTDEQLQLILISAKQKTEKQWLNPETKGIKILLSTEQKEAILFYKNKMVKSHTAESLIEQRLLRFSDHGLKRIALRIDRDMFPSEQALLGMANIVIQSQDVGNEAEWRGYRSISYNLYGEYDGRACTVSVVFDGPMLIITVITDEPTSTTYTMSTLLSSDVMTKLESMRNSDNQRQRKDRN